MNELRALNKMLGVVFDYGPSWKKKSRKVKKSARSNKKVNAKRRDR